MTIPNNRNDRVDASPAPGPHVNEYDVESVSVATTVPSITSDPKLPQTVQQTPSPYRDPRSEKKPFNWCLWLSCGCCLIFIAGIVLLIVFASRGDGSGDGGRGGAFFGGGGGGGRGSSSCFPAGELIQIEHQHQDHSSVVVPVEDLQPGSIAEKGGLVTAVFKLLPAEREVLYRYNHSAWVTGMHSVYEGDDSLTLVQDSSLASVVPTDHFWDPQGDYLYNVVTDRHKVVINGTLFSDWEEKDFCSKNVLQRLNHPDEMVGDLSCQPDEEDDDPSDPIDEGSFVGGTMVSRIGTGYPDTSIESLEPGDLIQGGVVLATVKIYQQSTGFVYFYRPASDPERTIEATKWTIVEDHDGEWRYIQDSHNEMHHRVLERGEVFYQLVTSSHRIVTTDGTVFSDYEVFDEWTGAPSAGSNFWKGLQMIFSKG